MRVSFRWFIFDLLLAFASSGGIIRLLVYMDDIVITGDESVGISQFKFFLQRKFQTMVLSATF